MTKKNAIIIAIIVVLPGGLFLAWLIWRYNFLDGIGLSGKLDDDGEQFNNQQMQQSLDIPYSQSPVKLNHFDIGEFDSPDVPGSGKNMKVSTLLMLDSARDMAQISFVVNSGYRTVAHNQALKGIGSVSNSSHLKGHACDIDADTDAQKRIILKSLVSAGFKRFGIYRGFVHCDNDPTKPSPAVWYGEGAPKIDPFKL